MRSPDRQLTTAWLLLLLLGQGASHGYDLKRELGALELEVEPSIMYRMLRAMERDGLVESQWTPSEVGPRRRLYRLTADGHRGLATTAALIGHDRDLHDAFVRAFEQSA